MRWFEGFYENLLHISSSITIVSRIKTDSISIENYDKSKHSRIKSKEDKVGFVSMIREEEKVKIITAAGDQGRLLVARLNRNRSRIIKLLGKELFFDLKKGAICEYKSMQYTFFMAMIDSEMLLISGNKNDLTKAQEVKNGVRTPFRGSETHKLIEDIVDKNFVRWSFIDSVVWRRDQIKFAEKHDKPEIVKTHINDSINVFYNHYVAFSYFEDDQFKSEYVEVYKTDKAAKDEYYRKRHNPQRKYSRKIGPDGKTILPQKVKLNRDILESNRIIKYRSKSLDEISEEYELVEELRERQKQRESGREGVR